MRCPICQSKTKVLNTRDTSRGTYRRRECLECLSRFSTQEIILINSIDRHLMDIMLDTKRD